VGWCVCGQGLISCGPGLSGRMQVSEASQGVGTNKEGFLGWRGWRLTWGLDSRDWKVK
jgi:hypothetical protein